MEKVVGSWAVCNNLSIEVLEINYDIEIELLVRQSNDHDTLYRKTVHFDGERAYIVYNGSELYVDECMIIK